LFLLFWLITNNFYLPFVLPFCLFWICLSWSHCLKPLFRLLQVCLWISCQDQMIQQTLLYLNRFALSYLFPSFGNLCTSSLQIERFFSLFISFQPLNRCLFPGSRAYNTFNLCTNPHCFELDGVR
jgi:hypothetical protein